MSKSKSATLLAKSHATTNASEFIRSHGEEGFSFQDEKFNSIYQRETKKLSAKLEKIAQKYIDKYKEIGIEINDEISDF